MSRRAFTSIVLSLFGIILTTGSALAQSAIAGLVRDQSGAVLPGVSVEASSPVLIEATRSAVTDDQGRYRVIDLRPGVYKLTFTLAGFGTVVREGVELPSAFAPPTTGRGSPP